MGSNPGRLVRLLRTTAFRFTLLYISLFLFAVTLLIIFVYESTFRPVIKQIDLELTTELAFFERVYTERSKTQMVQQVRARGRRRADALYLIVSAPNGMVLNDSPLKNMPGEALNTKGLFRFTYTPTNFRGDLNSSRNAMGRIGRIRDPRTGKLDFVILAARDVTALNQLQNNARSTMIRVGIVTLLLGLILGIITSRSFLSKVDKVNQAVAAIRKGDLSRRIPVEGGQDEFDGLAENLNGMLDQIERLMIGMREVSDNIAHDLRSPLTRIRNHIHEAMSLKGDDRDEALANLSLETEKLLETFNALLSITRLEAGEGAGVLKPINITTIVEQVADLYEPAAQDAGFTLTTELDPVPDILGSRELVSQALSNLLDNAFKYAKWPGTPTSIEPGKIIVSLRKTQGNNVKLTIADNGPGVTASDRPKILNRFVRLDQSRTTHGSGLGLSMVAAIARAHEASLTIADGLARKTPENSLDPSNGYGLSITLLFPPAPQKSPKLAPKTRLPGDSKSTQTKNFSVSP